ncbi:MAG: hypothetical protein ACLTER_10425 [Ruminococcus sp.]
MKKKERFYTGRASIVVAIIAVLVAIRYSLYLPVSLKKAEKQPMPQI